MVTRKDRMRRANLHPVSNLETGRAQPDPALRDGRAGTAYGWVTGLAIAFILGVVFYGLNAQRPHDLQTAAGTGQPAATTGQASGQTAGQAAPGGANPAAAATTGQGGAQTTGSAAPQRDSSGAGTASGESSGGQTQQSPQQAQQDRGRQGSGNAGDAAPAAPR